MINTRKLKKLFRELLKYGNANCYRNPKTLNERKQFSKYSRAKRRCLPTDWDDINKSKFRSKSWKDRSTRKHQYYNKDY